MKWIPDVVFALLHSFKLLHKLLNWLSSLRQSLEAKANSRCQGRLLGKLSQQTWQLISRERELDRVCSFCRLLDYIWIILSNLRSAWISSRIPISNYSWSGRDIKQWFYIFVIGVLNASRSPFILTAERTEARLHMHRNGLWDSVGRNLTCSVLFWFCPLRI